MLLALDVGNTNITVGCYDSDLLVGSFRLTSKMERTSDEFGVTLYDTLKARNVDASKITDVIISSVVPNIMHSLTNAIRKYFYVEPLIVEAGIKTGISIQIDEAKSLGADRLVDAVAAYNIYGGPCLIIDFGTATTYDYVNDKGVFLYGITAPGIGISGNALWSMAAQLPKIEIKKPDSILAKNTVTSMQAGLVYGYIGSVEYIIQMIRKELNSDFKVIATGGLGNIILPHTKLIDEYDADLAFKGMKIIYEKNRKVTR